MEECQGSPGALLDALRTINTPVKKKDGEIVRDVSNVAKLLMTTDDNVLHAVFYVKGGKKELADGTEISDSTWVADALDKYGASARRCDDETILAMVSNDPDRELFVFKLKDTILSDQYKMLRDRGFLPKEEEEDETLLGDDVFDSI